MLRGYPKCVDPPGAAWLDPKTISAFTKRPGLAYFSKDKEEGLEVTLQLGSVVADIIEQLIKDRSKC
jgi:hypothetical protein